VSIKRRLKVVLTALGRGDWDVSVLLTDDAGIQKLNREFRGVDQPTNVLAFNNGPAFPGEKDHHLGDLALSMETVRREARAADRLVGEIFYFYLVHGALHLVGYDHSLGPEQEAAQEEEQKRLLSLISHGL
jgi:probable rRNA maturation factor